MTAEDKKPYDKKAKEDKERYEREKEEYAVSLHDLSPKPIILTISQNKGAADEDEDEE